MAPGELHQRLDECLDLVEAGTWPALQLQQLQELVVTCEDYARWRRPAAGCDAHAAEMHLELDRALRSEGDDRLARTTRLVQKMQVKHRRRGDFARLRAGLAEAARRLSGARGRLEPDCSDPIASLADALAEFEPRLVKAYVRELLREDKYAYQHTDTRSVPEIAAIGELVNTPEFDLWVLDNPTSACGAVAQGHPQRDTWYLVE